MKKLALALVCLVSVAFFASCQEQITDPKPTISVVTGENYVQDGQVVDLYAQNYFGFTVASNPQTQKTLSTLKVYVDDNDWATIDLSGMTSFVYTDSVQYQLSKDIIGESVIKGIVTDIAGETATATITLQVNEPAIPLLGTAFSWTRDGTNVVNAEEMANFGLQWTGSYKDIMATIKPLDNAKLFVVSGDDFANINTVADKNAYFANLLETAEPVASYRNISTNASADYNDMLCTVDPQGAYHLVLVKHADIEYIQGVKTIITITGETK